MMIIKKDLPKLIEALQNEYDVFIPSKNGDAAPGCANYSLTPYNAGKEWAISLYRPTDPLKILFYPPRDQVLPFIPVHKKRIIFGVKNCDLKALTILDRALIDDPNFTDLQYQEWRELTYIVGADCSEVLPTCHCNLLNLKPYPQSNSDLIMSEIESGYYLAAKTPKGEEIIGFIKKHLSPSESNPDQIQVEIEQNRGRVMDLLTEQKQKFSSYPVDREIKNNLNSEQWSKKAATCVECGACSYICPTCYCILIKDQTEKSKEFRKIKTWDSCQHTGYAKVAGGGTPRPNLWQRFRHRYLCKFSVMVDNFSETGCTGCGRCIACCPAKIDIRETVESVQVK